MNIPWAKPYIGKEEYEAVRRCFDTKWLSSGAQVKRLEGMVSGLSRAKFTVGVNSGTAALDIALKVIGVRPGDEVIIPALSYIATGNAVLYQHATPVFADIDRDTFTISPGSIERNLSDRTKAVIAIDYAGQAADYDSIRDVIKGRKIYLIEDGAPGFGGKYKNKALCALGDIGITSFHMAKIFTTVEGGMLFTDNGNWADDAKIMRSQGEDPEKKYFHPIIGHNYRMTDIQASIGIEQLNRFGDVLAKRNSIADKYSAALKGIAGLDLPVVKDGNDHAWFLYPVKVEQRQRVVARLREKGIGVNVSWPMPIYEQPVYRKFRHAKCPVAKEFTGQVMCLPMYYEMTGDEQDYVISTLSEIIKKGK